MAWEAPGRKEHHVDPYVIARSGEARAQHFGGGGNAAEAIVIDREVEVLRPVAPLDLDEGDRAAAARDEVDFADRDTEPLAEDTPAVEAEPPGGAALGLAPARLGRGALQSPPFPESLSASARA